jgi:YgiT-type zinc finger domain-containing protein
MTTEREKHKRCPLCGGDLREETAILPFVVNDSVVVVKGVAAEVCRDCGEAFLSGAATDAVTGVLREAVSRRVELAVITLPENIPSPASAEAL